MTLDPDTATLLTDAARELDHLHADHAGHTTTVGMPIAVIQPLAAILRWVAGHPRPNLTDSAVAIARAVTADPGGAAPASSNTPGAGE